MIPTAPIPPGAATAADPWMGRLLGGRWRILSLLDDSGGMASVYLADDERLPRKAVVKIPKAAQFNTEFAERFAREAFWHAKVDNLHVVHILDRGEEAGTPFLVLQYLPGGNLKAWCERNPTILADPRRHYESWLLPIAQALDAVAAQGIVHRDVKPTNILFDAGGQAYLSDFGIVRAGDDATMTGTGMFIGTLQFMSPEQCQPEAKRTLDGRSDQFGLAVTVYQVLTGWRYPVEDDTAVVYAAKFGHVAMTPPGAHDPGIPQSVSDAVMRALSADRTRRFGSSVEFAKSMLEGFDTATVVRPALTAIPAITPLAAPRTAGRPAEPSTVPPQQVCPPPLPRSTQPIPTWRWFRGFPDLALAAGIARFGVGALAALRIHEAICAIWAYQEMTEAGYTYLAPSVAAARLANGIAVCVLAPTVIFLGWGGVKGRIGAAVLLSLFVLAHIGLAVRGIGPGLQIGDAVSFDWNVAGGSDLGWAMVAGVAGGLAIMAATPCRDQPIRRGEVTAGVIGRGLMALPVFTWVCDTSVMLFSRRPNGPLGVTALLIIVLGALAAVPLALLTGFRARSSAVVVLFTITCFVSTIFDVPREYLSLFFAYLCGLLLVVTAGPGVGSLDVDSSGA